MINMVFPKSIQAFSLDTGDEIGVTPFRQPPLPPLHPPGTYPPEQMRRWWVSKECVSNYTLTDALREVKGLFQSRNTYTLQYFDGYHLMPIVNDRDLQSCLRYFLANASNPDVCRIFLEEKLPKVEESFKAQIEVTPAQASSTKELSKSLNAGSSHSARSKTKSTLTEEQRLKTFRARVLNKHGTNAAVSDKNTITCSYDQCGKKTSCKQFNQQNFDTHVKFCHTSKKKSGSADIRLLLTMIGQSEQEQREENLED